MMKPGKATITSIISHLLHFNGLETASFFCPSGGQALLALSEHWYQE